MRNNGIFASYKRIKAIPVMRYCLDFIVFIVRKDLEINFRVVIAALKQLFHFLNGGLTGI